MDLLKLGATGLRVSPVGFGASPLRYVFGDVPHDTARAAVRHALDLGVNFFDTSPYYGSTVSKSVLSDCLRSVGFPRGPRRHRHQVQPDFSAARIMCSVDESLTRLGLDCVDILDCHDIEFTNLDQIANETILALQKIEEEGRGWI